MEPKDLKARLWFSNVCNCITIALTIVTLSLVITATVRAGDVGTSLSSVLSTFSGASVSSIAAQMGRAQGTVALPCFSAPLSPMPTDWVVVGDYFAGAGADVTDPTLWYNRLAASLGVSASITVETLTGTDDGSTSFSTLIGRAASDADVVAAIAAQRPLLIFAAWGYERLLARYVSPDVLFTDIAAGIAQNPALFSNPNSAIIILPRPLPLGSMSPVQFIPTAALPCGPSRAGAALNQPPSVDASALLAETSSAFPTTAFGLALGAYPIQVGAADISGLFAKFTALASGGPFAAGSCLYLSSAGNQLLADYLQTCISAQPYSVPS